MTTKCSNATAFDGEIDNIEGKLDMNHIAACPQCARLFEGHQILASAFQDTPHQSASIHFNRELRDRLRTEHQFERQIRLRSVVLRAYWLLASLASLLTLWLVPWPSQVISGPVVAAISVFLGLVAIVPAMIYRGLGLDQNLI